MRRVLLCKALDSRIELFFLLVSLINHLQLETLLSIEAASIHELSRRLRIQLVLDNGPKCWSEGDSYVDLREADKVLILLHNPEIVHQSEEKSSSDGQAIHYAEGRDAEGEEAIKHLLDEQDGSELR